MPGILPKKTGMTPRRRNKKSPLRAGFCLAALLTAALTLAACRDGADDPAVLLQKAEAAMEATPCSHAVLEVTMELTLDGADAVTVNTNDITVSRQPVSSRILTDTAVTVGDTVTHTTAQAYSVPMGQMLTTYVESDGIWLSAPGAEQLSMSLSASALTADTGTLALDESVTVWEDRPVRCLTTHMGGEQLQQLLSGVLGTPQDGGAAVSGEEIGCDARILLDAETYLPIREEMTFTGMSEALAPLYPDGSLTVHRCTAVDRFVSYGPQDAVQLPEGAAEKADAWQRLLQNEPDNGDGSFTVREGTVLADVVTPDGCSPAEKAYDHVTFTRGDGLQAMYAVYYLTDSPDGAALRAVVDNDAADREAAGCTVEREQTRQSVNGLTFDCEILDTAGSDHTGRCFYAWTVLETDADGAYCLYVKVTDGCADDPGEKDTVPTEEDLRLLLGCASRSRFAG